MFEFGVKDIAAIVKIDFDIEQGPVLKEVKKLDENFNVNIEDLFVNIYLWFMGGSLDKPKPRFIAFDEFSIAAFIKEMEVTCVFIKGNDGLEKSMSHIREIVEKIERGEPITEEKKVTKSITRRRRRRRRRR
ncbi:MAG: hypothetical protein ACTSXJ_04465 [Candidatus Baldrarchaeia archaeon]